MQTIQNKSKSYAVFWGCLIPARLPWIEKAARAVLPALGVHIVDLPFSCCPDPIASRSLDHLTWLSLAARNLSLAEEQKMDIITLCSGCFETLKTVQLEMKDSKTRYEVNQILAATGRCYEGAGRILHCQQWLYSEFGLDLLSQSIVAPMGMRVATHTGCHYTRPGHVMQTDDPVFPEQLDELCEILGLETMDYPDKNLCCGVGIGLVDREIPNQLIQRKIDGAVKAGAKALVAHCPSCILSYDMGQAALCRKKKISNTLPVFHYLELLGMALGLKKDVFAFEEHTVPVTGFFQ